MHKLLEKLDKELCKYADKEGELSKSEWQDVFPAIEARYQLLTSMAMEGEDQYGNYYEDEEEMEPMYSSYRGSYRGSSRGGSRRGGRSMMMDPDLMYSNSRRGSYRNGNSRAYSGHGDDVLDSLYMALDRANSEEERRAIKAVIDRESKY